MGFLSLKQPHNFAAMSASPQRQESLGAVLEAGQESVRWVIKSLVICYFYALLMPVNTIRPVESSTSVLLTREKARNWL